MGLIVFFSEKRVAKRIEEAIGVCRLPHSKGMLVVQVDPHTTRKELKEKCGSESVIDPNARSYRSAQNMWFSAKHSLSHIGYRLAEDH